MRCFQGSFSRFSLCFRMASLTRPSRLLSRPIGLPAIGPSVGIFRKLPFSMLAFRQFQQQKYIRNKRFKGVPQLQIDFFTRLTNTFFRILPRMFRRWQSWWCLPLHFNFSFFDNILFVRNCGEFSSTEKNSRTYIFTDNF